MEQILFLPHRLDDDSTFTFLSKLWQYGHLSKLTLDFSALEYALPFGTLVLAAQIRSFITQTECKVQVSGVSPQGKHSYLAYVGFFKVFGFAIGKQPGEAPGSSSYIPITVLTLNELERRRTEYHATHGKFLPLGNFIQRESERLALMVTQENKEKINAPIAYCFREVIRNVFEHGETDRCAVFAQKWQDGSIEIAIIDRGQGVISSLGKRHAFTTDYEALTQAVRPGVSGKDITAEGDEWTNSGFGLYVLSELGRRLGGFSLCSGGCGLVTQGGALARAEYRLDQGTAVRLRVKKPKGVNFWDYIQKIIDEGEELTARAGSPVKASKSTRISILSETDE